MAISPAHPRIVTADLMHHLVGRTSTSDDVALVVLRRTPDQDPQDGATAQPEPG